MSTSDEEEVENAERSIKKGSEDSTQADAKGQLAFVLILKKHKVLLEKSQVPAVKDKKKEASDKMLQELRQKNALEMTEDQLRKKLNNMKQAIKKKTDKNATGNKKIVLSEWEKEFLSLLDEENPVLCRIPGKSATIFLLDVYHSTTFVYVGAASVGADFPVISTKPELKREETSALVSYDTVVSNKTDVIISAGNKRVLPPPPPPEHKKKRKAEDVISLNETAETKELSLAQLQRLVLLKQLELINLKLLKIKPEEGVD